jgi:hypothetical protein
VIENTYHKNLKYLSPALYRKYLPTSILVIWDTKVNQIIPCPGKSSKSNEKDKHVNQ